MFIPKDRVDCKKQEITFGLSDKIKYILSQLKQWLEFSVKKYKIKKPGIAGSIVMNCNPFTLGHRYLIETVNKNTDILYVFVVEENKLFFDFDDRFQMVKIDVRDIKNVIVIPSGKYMISTETLPGYFEKGTKPFVEFDATDDLFLFSNIIAKAFGITIRFAGNEPSDDFTNHYNETMRRMLPKYGIRFCEIPRKELNGQVISASIVRQYIKEKRYEECKKFLCPDVYTYLMDLCLN